MSRIKIHDKYFESFITESQLEDAVSIMAEKLNNEMARETPIFLAILNGSFMFASDLLKKVTIPCEISFVKFTSYSGTSSTQNLSELIGLEDSIKGRTIVIVEDIIDTGFTLKRVIEKLNELGVKRVFIATLLFKPDAFKMSYPIDLVGIEIPNDFIVGYGLDYDKLGRNLKNIYKIVE